MRHGPLEIYDPIKEEIHLSCQGCEFSNQKLVVDGLIEGRGHTGTVFHCLKIRKDEVWVVDKTPAWCPFKTKDYE